MRYYEPRLVWTRLTTSPWEKDSIARAAYDPLAGGGSKGRAQGKEAITHTNRHTGRASTVL